MSEPYLTSFVYQHLVERFRFDIRCLTFQPSRQVMSECMSRVNSAPTQSLV